MKSESYFLNQSDPPVEKGRERDEIRTPIRDNSALFADRSVTLRADSCPNSAFCRTFYLSVLHLGENTLALNLTSFAPLRMGSVITRFGEGTSKSSTTKTGTTRRRCTPSQDTSIQNGPHTLAYLLPLLHFIPKCCTTQSVAVNTLSQVAAAEFGGRPLDGNFLDYELVGATDFSQSPKRPDVHKLQRGPPYLLRRPPPHFLR